jgi:hypothetical protein
MITLLYTVIHSHHIFNPQSYSLSSSCSGLWTDSISETWNECLSWSESWSSSQSDSLKQSISLSYSGRKTHSRSWSWSGYS